MQSLVNTYALLGSGELLGLDALLFVGHYAAVRDSLWGRYVWCLLVGWIGLDLRFDCRAGGQLSPYEHGPPGEN